MERGFLEGYSYGNSSFRNSYDAIGLATGIDDSAGLRRIHKTKDTWQLNNETTFIDHFGRMTKLNKWQFKYGANDQILNATKEGSKLDFSYDDAGLRIY